MSAILFFALGCASVPRDIPPEDLPGIITVNINRSGPVNGIFEVRHEEEEFSVYLYSPGPVPLGSIIVSEGKIVKNSTGIDEKLVNIFRYWPHIFGGGKKRGSETRKIGGVKITYGSFSGDYPQNLTVVSEDMEIDIGIIYGD